MVSYPTPMGGRTGHTLGLVTALDEAQARDLVLQFLASAGLNIRSIDPLEIGLMHWDTTISHVDLFWGGAPNV